MAATVIGGGCGGVGRGLRLAVVGTPRSGNTWVRSMLAAFYGLAEIAPPTQDDVDWEDLPDRCVIQLHEWPEDLFLGRLARNGVRVVSPARHPFDVMMSWLNYIYYVHEDGRCRAGSCNECGLVGVLPRSGTFVDYVAGFHGRAVLGFTPWWWRRPEVIRVRYEDLVADPSKALARLESEVGEPFGRPVAEVLDATSIARKKPSRDGWQYHFWQGEPGLWRSMLTATEARVLAGALAGPFDALPYTCDPFAELGYACDPDETLEPAQADRNWLSLQLDSVREHLALEKAKHRAALRDVEALRGRLAEVDAVSMVAVRPHGVRVDAPHIGLFDRMRRFGSRRQAGHPGPGVSSSR